MARPNIMLCSRASPPSPSLSQSSSLSSSSPSPSRPSCHQRIDVLAWDPSPSPSLSFRSSHGYSLRHPISLFGSMTLYLLVCLPLFLSSHLPMIAAMEMEHSNSTIFFKSPFFALGVTTFDVSAEIVRASPTDGCDRMSPDMAGKAVWIEPYRCSIETKIRNCQEAGCIAGISASAYIVPGEEMWTAWETSLDRSRLHVPFVHLGRNDAETIRALLAEKEARPESRYRVKVVNGTDYVVQLASWHPGSRNDWETAFESTYFTLFFQVFLASSNFIVLVVAARKLRRFWLIRKNRAHFATVPLVCLSLVILGNLERCIYLGVDPMGSRHLLPTFARRFMLSISIPWNFASTLLLIFFWSEAIAKHQEPIRFLSYFKIPFIVTTLSLASIDLMFAIIDSLYLTDMLLLPIIEVLYAAVGVIISLLFFIVAFRVIRRFQYEALRRTSCSIWASSATAKENLRIKNESRAKIVRMTQFLVINGIGMLLFLVIVSLTPWSDSALNTPFSVISKWWLLYAALAIQGACQVCAF